MIAPRYVVALSGTDLAIQSKYVGFPFSIGNDMTSGTE